MYSGLGKCKGNLRDRKRVYLYFIVMIYIYICMYIYIHIYILLYICIYVHIIGTRSDKYFGCSIYIYIFTLRPIDIHTRRGNERKRGQKGVRVSWRTNHWRRYRQKFQRGFYRRTLREVRSTRKIMFFPVIER